MKKLLFAACLAAFCLTSCNNGKNNTQDLANQQNEFAKQYHRSER